MGGVTVCFPLRDLSLLHRREGLHLCEQDSMIWVHFCLFEVVVGLCIEFLYLWVSRGREADGVSFNNESFGSFSEVRYHV